MQNSLKNISHRHHDNFISIYLQYLMSEFNAGKGSRQV